MTDIASTRPARTVRIHCPVEAATLQAMLAGQADAAMRDPALAAMLAIIRADNVLGDFGSYKGVVEIGLGFESFIPAVEARPAYGTAGAPAISPTVILTTYVAAEASDAAIAVALDSLMAAHPWEVPVIEVAPTTLVVRR